MSTSQVDSSLRELDLVNEDDEVVGRALRKDIHAQGLLHREIHVWVFNDKQEILLQKRAKNKDTYPGAWDVSVGGHVELGATYEESAVKELKEETGITVNIDDLIFIIKKRSISYDQKTGMTNNVLRAVYAYKYNSELDILRIEEGKADALEWWPVNTILGLTEEDRKDYRWAIMHNVTLEALKLLKSLMGENS